MFNWREKKKKKSSKELNTNKTSTPSRDPEDGGLSEQTETNTHFPPQVLLDAGNTHVHIFLCFSPGTTPFRLYYCKLCNPSWLLSSISLPLPPLPLHTSARQGQTPAVFSQDLLEVSSHWADFFHAALLALVVPAGWKSF